MCGSFLFISAWVSIQTLWGNKSWMTSTSPGSLTPESSSREWGIWLIEFYGSNWVSTVTKDDRRARAESIKTLKEWIQCSCSTMGIQPFCGSSRNPSSSQGLTHCSGHQFSLPRILDLRGAGVWTESTVSCTSWPQNPPLAPQLGLPDLANKNAECLDKFEFQILNE